MSQATPIKKPVKKCAPHPTCADGQHVYIITCWKEGNGQRKAVHMRCQHCLMPLDLQEIEGAEWNKKNGIES